MKKQIAITLPVKDLERSKAFFGALGFSFNPQFSSEHGCGMVVSDDIFVMLCAESFFGTLTSKPLADPRTSTIALLCLFCDSRAEVDALAGKALALGLRQSELHSASFRDSPLMPAEEALFDELARKSVDEQAAIEGQDSGSFDDFVAAYNCSKLCSNQ